MTQNEPFILKYEMDGDNIQPGERPDFPVEIEVTCHNVEYAKPSKRELRISNKNIFPPCRISINEDDISDIKTFYMNQHNKLPGLPNHNKYFVFIDTQEWSGFLTNDAQVCYIVSHHAAILIVVFSDTYFERAVKIRNSFTIPQEMVQFLRTPLPQLSQAHRVASAIRANSIMNRNRIEEGSNNSEIQDITQPRMSSLTIAANDPYICLIPVTPKFKPLLLGLNMVLTTMDIHLYPRNRTIQVNEDLVRQIVIDIIQQHVPGSSESDQSSNSEEEENHYSDQSSSNEEEG